MQGFKNDAKNESNNFDLYFSFFSEVFKSFTVEPLLRDHPFERPPPLERPLDNVNLNINVLISTPDERPPLLKGLFTDAKAVASQEGFHCISYVRYLNQLYLKDYPSYEGVNSHMASA